MLDFEIKFCALRKALFQNFDKIGMLQSKYFIKTKKESPSDEPSINAQLLMRGSFIDKEMAGVYSFLPLGLRGLRKIENIEGIFASVNNDSSFIILSSLTPI